MTTAKKDLTLILPNPLLSFMMHMDPCVLSYLDAISFPFKLSRWQIAKAARIELSTGTSFSKFSLILTELQTKNKQSKQYCILIAVRFNNRNHLKFRAKESDKVGNKTGYTENYRKLGHREKEESRKKDRNRFAKKSKLWLMGMREKQKSCLIVSN